MLLLRGLRRKYHELIVLKDYTLMGGSARPIYNYYKHQLATSEKKIALLRLVYRHSYLKLLYLSLFSDRVIINGISCFNYWIVLFICFAKRNLIIYLHEAAPHAEPFAEKSPLKFKLFVQLLNNKKVAFVSEWQRQYFQKFVDIQRYKIIYNNMNFPYTRSGDENIVTVGMVAYQSRYKNVSFFSKVADEAARRILPYKFIWVGGEGGEMKEMYHSEQVEWLGDQEHVMDTLNSIDILLFTSYGDTFGLVLTEALFKGKRIVSYAENGLSPFITELKGCRIYDKFDEALVLKFLDEVLKETVDINKHKELAYYLCSMENFEKRLEEIFAL